MVQIQKEAGVFKTILTRPRLKHTRYKLSEFVYMYEIQDKVLAYHTLTRAVYILSVQEKEIINQCPCTLADLNDKAVDDLVQNRILVEEEMDEESDYLEIFEFTRSFDLDENVNSYMILTTTACNARCFYCFESGFISSTMREDTAKAVGAYITKHQKGRVNLHWFGGEPLCNTNAIDTICKELTDNSVDFYSNMISNGSLITDEIIEKAKNIWKLKQIQITLDGMADVHNARKNYVNKDIDAFELTVSNIDKLLTADIRVSIRINFDKSNLESVRELVPFLVKRYENYPKLSIYPVVLYEECSAWKSGRSEEQNAELRDAYHHLWQYIGQAGKLPSYRIQRSIPLTHCGANNVHHRTINPDGTFNVCNNLDLDETYGNVIDGITNPSMFEKWTKNGKVRDRCKGCRWLPECTAFAQCPIIHSNCKETHENRAKLSLDVLYRKWQETNVE